MALLGFGTEIQSVNDDLKLNWDFNVFLDWKLFEFSYYTDMGMNLICLSIRLGFIFSVQTYNIRRALNNIQFYKYLTLQSHKKACFIYFAMM